MAKRIQRDRQLTPEEAGRLRQARAEFSNRPSKKELLASGYAGPMSLEEYLAWRKGAGEAPLAGQLDAAAGGGSAIECPIAEARDFERVA